MLYLDKSIVIIFGMAIGLVSIYLGYMLFIKGIDGSASMEAGVKKMKLSLRNASPGLFFALFGAVLVVNGIIKDDIRSEKQYEDGELVHSIYTKKGGDERSTLSIDVTELFNFAVLLKGQGQTEKALGLYERILDADSTHHMSCNNLALLYINFGNSEQALELANRAVKHGENSEYLSNYYDTLAKAYEQTNEMKSAITAMTKALELDPENSGYQERLISLNKNK